MRIAPRLAPLALLALAFTATAAWNPLTPREVETVDPVALVRRASRDPKLLERVTSAFRYTGPVHRREFLQRFKAAAVSESDAGVKSALTSLVAKFETIPLLRIQSFRFKEVERQEFLDRAATLGLRVHLSESKGWFWKSNFHFLVSGPEKSMDELAAAYPLSLQVAEKIEEIRLKVRYKNGGTFFDFVVETGTCHESCLGMVDAWTAMGMLESLAVDPGAAVKAMIDGGAIADHQGPSDKIRNVSWEAFLPFESDPFMKG